MAKRQSSRAMAPIEYVAISGVLAAFALVVVLMVTRDWTTAWIGSGVTFVVVILGISMLLLAMKPNAMPEGEKPKPDSGND